MTCTVSSGTLNSTIPYQTYGHGYAQDEFAMKEEEEERAQNRVSYVTLRTSRQLVHRCALCSMRLSSSSRSSSPSSMSLRTVSRSLTHFCTDTSPGEPHRVDSWSAVWRHSVSDGCTDDRSSFIAYSINKSSHEPVDLLRLLISGTY